MIKDNQESSFAVWHQKTGNFAERTDAMTITLPTFDSATTPTPTAPPAQPEVLPQPVTAQNAEAEQQPEPKLQYSHIELGPFHYGHGWVYFTNGAHESLTKFTDIQRVSEMMDNESAQKFQVHVVQLKANGELQKLLSPEERSEKEAAEQQRREQQTLAATIKNLMAMEKKLNEKFTSVAIAKLSKYALARKVMSPLQDMLLQPELEPYFQEMSGRGWSISIKLETNEDGEDVEFKIDADDLVNEDVSEELADAEADEEEYSRELAKLRSNNK